VHSSSRQREGYKAQLSWSSNENTPSHLSLGKKRRCFVVVLGQVLSVDYEQHIDFLLKIDAPFSVDLRRRRRNYCVKRDDSVTRFDRVIN
jgi:hypothetical protein